MDVAILSAGPAGEAACQDGTDMTTAQGKACEKGHSAGSEMEFHGRGKKKKKKKKNKPKTTTTIETRNKPWDRQDVHLTGRRLGT